MVVCYDSFDSYYAPQIKRKNISGLTQNPLFALVEADIRDGDALQRTFANYKVDTVVHLAARAGVRPSIQQPELYYDVNVMGTLRLLEAMHVAGVNQMVFGSSSSVYGNSPNVPFSEADSVDHPISPYAASKKAGELLCHTYHHLYGFDIFCLRFFTVYGPRQRPDMAIHQFIRKILEGDPITLYGDGASRRDYTFIDDIVQGVEKAISKVAGYEIINLGESSTIALIDLIRVIEEELGVKARIEWKPMQPGDVETTYADIARARTILGYAPGCSMKEGIHRFCEWFKSERED
jgi:UDP-glucuronate 4-epimerase